MVIGEFRGFLQFAASLVEKLFSLLSVTAQFSAIGSLGFIDFFKRPENVVLSRRQIRVPAWINVGAGGC